MTFRWKKMAVLQNTPPLFGWLLAVSLCIAMIPTLWKQLDLSAASLFEVKSPVIASASWWWVEWINVNIPFAFRVVLGLVLLGWLLAIRSARWSQWRFPLAFVVFAGLMGPGLIVNAVVKDNWQRARPFQVDVFGGAQHFTRAGVITDQCDHNCSFVSGHVACGFFLASFMLVHRRRQMAWAIAGTTAGLVIGFARMSYMDHWLSDVLWAYPITLVSSWLVWACLSQIYHPTDDPSDPQLVNPHSA